MWIWVNLWSPNPILDGSLAYKGILKNVKFPKARHCTQKTRRNKEKRTNTNELRNGNTSSTARILIYTMNLDDSHVTLM